MRSDKIMICSRRGTCENIGGCGHCVPHWEGRQAGICTGDDAVCYGKMSPCVLATLEQIVLFRLEGGKIE
jgi:NADH pyrophosphatase NudC (nudix superfamily)